MAAKACTLKSGNNREPGLNFSQKVDTLNNTECINRPMVDTVRGLILLQRVGNKFTLLFYDLRVYSLIHLTPREQIFPHALELDFREASKAGLETGMALDLISCF